MAEVRITDGALAQIASLPLRLQGRVEGSWIAWSAGRT